MKRLPEALFILCILACWNPGAVLTCTALVVAATAAGTLLAVLGPAAVLRCTAFAHACVRTSPTPRARASLHPAWVGLGVLAGVVWFCTSW